MRPLRRLISSFLRLSWAVPLASVLLVFNLIEVEGAWVDPSAKRSSRWSSLRVCSAHLSQDVNSSWYSARVIDVFGFHAATRRWKWKLNLLCMMWSCQVRQSMCFILDEIRVRGELKRLHILAQLLYWFLQPQLFHGGGHFRCAYIVGRVWSRGQWISC